MSEYVRSNFEKKPTRDFAEMWSALRVGLFRE
jgi:hypothetical protein